MTEHPAWPWVVFGVNTSLVLITVASILSLIFQQQTLVKQINHIDRMLVNAVRINQSNVNIVAKKAGVPDHKIVQPEIPGIPEVK